MPEKELLVDLDPIDLTSPIADLDEIRKYNPQRFEMEQLTGVLYENMDEGVAVAYKDITDEDFWTRGHMPNMPLMPGVVMLEACAQACSFFCQKNDMLGADMLGFGGLDEVRFRDPVTPGDRLIIICKLIKARRNRMVVCQFQGVVNGNLAVEGILRGIPIPIDQLRAALQSK